MEAAAAHLHEAYALFQRLQAPRYLDRTRQLATACGISLTAEHGDDTSIIPPI